MNPLLQKTEDAIMSRVNPPQLQPVVQKIVDAGKKVMYSPETRDLLIKQLSALGEPAEVIGAGVAGLLGILVNQSKGTIPMQAGIPAATILLCEGLDLLEQAHSVQVTPDFLAECMQDLSSALLQAAGVTPEKLQALASKAGS
ncbi:MAG: hypothetical protein V4505_00715 [Pseudomonadota bacterium]